MAPPTILLNDFARQWADVRYEVLRTVDAVGASGWYVLGESVLRFERQLAGYWAQWEAIGVASGMDAIELALRACGLQPGDRVLTTPLSAFATTLAIVRLGGIPVFCDTDELGLMDLNEARQALQAMPRIRYILPVHLYGFPIDSAGLRSIVSEFELTCIEDCAQSIGATQDGIPTGGIGRAAVTSFYPTKNLGALGDGGAVITNDATIAGKVRRLRDYGQAAKYRHSEIGWNSRLDELQAAILADVFLPRLERATKRRREIAEQYLKNWPSQRVRPFAEGKESKWKPSWHLFPVRVPAAEKSSFQEWLRANGIATGEHYPILIPDQEAMSSVSHTSFGPLERAGRIASGEVSLPIHPYLTGDEVDRVLDAVARWR